MTVYDNIERALPLIENGWCDVGKAIAMASIVMAIRPNVVVEIGVFGGRSLIPMAMVCQFNGRGKVIGIDPWMASAAVEGYEGENAKWWASLDYEKIYSTFLSDLKNVGVSDIVQVLRKKSDDVDPPEVIDVLHIDGQHSDQAVRDAERFGSRVRRGGFCITDDDNWAGGGPAAAIKSLMAMNFVPLYQLGTGTVFQRA